MPIRQLAFVPCESRTNRARPTPLRDGCSDPAAKIRATTSRPLEHVRRGREESRAHAEDREAPARHVDLAHRRLDGERLREGRPRLGGDGRVVTPVAVDMDPLSLLCRLATAVPPPRFHTVKYSGGERLVGFAVALVNFRVFKADPTRLRQKLLRFFERGQVLLDPQPDGTYVALSTLLPLVALAEMKEPAIRKPRVPSLSSNCCAGALRALEHDGTQRVLARPRRSTRFSKPVTFRATLDSEVHADPAHASPLPLSVLRG
jgi:hypothetical protein